VELVTILIFKLLRLAPKMLQELTDECAGAGRRIEDLDIAINKRLTEMVLAQPIGALIPIPDRFESNPTPANGNWIAATASPRVQSDLEAV
jgi:hypothetical protein